MCSHLNSGHQVESPCFNEDTPALLRCYFKHRREPCESLKLLSEAYVGVHMMMSAVSPAAEQKAPGFESTSRASAGPSVARSC